MQHAHMALPGRSPSRRSDFAAWLRAQRQPAPPPADSADAARAGGLPQRPARSATPSADTGAAARVGPDLTHVAQPPHARRRHPAEHARAPRGWIVDPQTIKPGNHMPPISLDAEDLQALLAYLESLK